MRKSSLGRRSSTHIPVRVPSVGASGQRTCSGGKKMTSLLKQPGFLAQSRRRSQSEDRESYGGRPMPSSLQRASSISSMTGRGLGAMTPITPRMSIHSNLPTGSARPQRGQTMSIESNRRMSSFGGTKNSRKDPRPINEKSFQQAAQAKVQQYFEENALEVLGEGNNVRKMNTKLFVDMMDNLLKCFDSRICITKTNYLEELPTLLRKFGYRLKIDRSWLMTVNIAHSWPHVVAVLSWLVEMVECMNAVEPFEMMYPSQINEPDCNEEDGDENIIFDKDLIGHLKKTYRYQDDIDTADEMDSEFVKKLILDSKCTDEDLEILQREIELVGEELNNETQRKNHYLEALEKLKAKHDAILADYETTKEFIDQSKLFVETTEKKLVAMEKEINAKKDILAKKQDDLQKLQDKVSTQKISVDDKEQLTKEKHDLHRMIQFYESGIREYEKSAFSTDLKLVEDQRKLEKLIVEYNKLVAEKTVVEPRLKDVEVNFTLLNKTKDVSMELVDSNLKSLKEEYKNTLRALETRKEKADNILWRLKQDEKETKEEIDKETTLLEGVECDLETQEESINKETLKLKEEINRYQMKAKEIMEEIAQFDPAKLEGKKLELKKLEHDWEVLQKRTKLLLEGTLEINQEVLQMVKVSLDKRNAKLYELKMKHQLQ